MIAREAFHTMKDLLRQRLEESQPPLALRAGRRVMDELLTELAPAPPGGEREILDAAVALTTSLHQQATQLRQDWKGLVDAEAEAGAQALSAWWLANHEPSPRGRRLLRSQRPDGEACQELFLLKIHRLEQKIEILLRLIRHMPLLEDLEEGAPRFLELLWALALHPGRWTLRVAALEGAYGALQQGIKGLRPAAQLDHLWRDPKESPWVRAAALRVLSLLDLEGTLAALASFLAQPDDQAFIARRAFLSVVAEWGQLGHELLLRAGAQDPSPAVRQRAVELLLASHAPLSDLVIEAFGRDPSRYVRAAWALAMVDQQPPRVWARALRLAVAHLPKERVEATAQACLKALANWMLHLEEGHATGEIIQEAGRLADALEAQALRGLPLSLTAWWWLVADLARIWADGSMGRHLLLHARKELDNLAEGQTLFIPQRFLSEDKTLNEAVLAALASLGLGLYARETSKGLYLIKGQQRRFRLWRLLHEVRHPSPSKRQGHGHMTGLVNPGAIWFPSLVMAEVTRTGVPGERVYYPPLGHGAPQVPGPTEALQAFGHGLTRIITPDAVVALRGPKSLWGRLSGRARLAWSFGALDERRHQALRQGSPQALQGYLAQYSACVGQRVTVASRGEVWEKAFATEAAPLLSAGALAGLVDQDLSYFVTPYANEMSHLAIFLGAFGIFLLGRSALRARRIRAWRESLPLCIGGWGSRGKSGSERLKAALFHGLGYQVLAKVTGTRPVLVSAIPGMEAVEIPLFRPYDRASLDEQVQVLGHAVARGTQVFLWEAMAIDPDYGRMMSQDWMRDDLTTITNAYPDHEDKQGPTGDDVARSLSSFVPTGGRLITSEQQMAPLLKEEARSRGATVEVAGPALAELVPQEFLERFPYLEHPANIALVLTLAQELGVDRDMALTLMADHVVPDLGALKRYPDEKIFGRTVSFANLMAANERESFLSGLGRLGLDGWEGARALSERVILIYNNREDRPSRAQAFARIMVEEGPAHGVVVVGTGVRAFRALLERELDRYLHERRQPASGDPTSQLAWVKELFHPLRRSPDQAAWDQALAVWLGKDVQEVRAGLAPAMERLRAEGEGGFGERVEDLVRAVRGEVEEALRGLVPERMRYLVEAEDLARTVTAELVVLAMMAMLVALSREAGALMGEAARRARALARSLFLSRVALFTDPGVAGEVVIRAAAEMSPWGSVVHLVGTGNIQGAGMRVIRGWGGDLVQRLEGMAGKRGGRRGGALGAAIRRWLDFRDVLGRRRGADRALALLEEGLISQGEAARRVEAIRARQEERLS